MQPFRSRRQASIPSRRPSGVQPSAARPEGSRPGDGPARLGRGGRLDVLRDFIPGLAHAVNNPLAGLSACVDVMARSEGDPERLRRYAAMSREAIGRIAVVVRQLAETAQADRTRVRAVDLNGLVRRRVAAEPEAGGDRGLETELWAGDLWAVADPTDVDQALGQMVTNARQATPEGGVVRVATGPASGGDAPFARIDVDDEGPGVPEGLRDRVFEPFFTTRGEGEGAGLGLWIVWNVAERSGGRVAVSCAPGGGARFSLYLPRATAAF